jgi:hypothetical protein
MGSAVIITMPTAQGQRAGMPVERNRVDWPANPSLARVGDGA